MTSTIRGIVDVNTTGEFADVWKNHLALLRTCLRHQHHSQARRRFFGAGSVVLVVVAHQPTTKLSVLKPLSYSSSGTPPPSQNNVIQ